MFRGFWAFSEKLYKPDPPRSGGLVVGLVGSASAVASVWILVCFWSGCGGIVVGFWAVTVWILVKAFRALW